MVEMSPVAFAALLIAAACIGGSVTATVQVLRDDPDLEVTIEEGPDE